MKRMKKFLCGVLLAGIIFVGKGMIPQTVEAAKSDFVIENGILMEYTGKSSEVVIPSTVKHIDSMAFYNKTHITSVVVPKSVAYIELGAFRGCGNLQDLTFLNPKIVHIDGTWDQNPCTDLACDEFETGYGPASPYPGVVIEHSIFLKDIKSEGTGSYKSLVIHGYAGSTAEAATKVWKKLKGNPYKSITFKSIGGNSTENKKPSSSKDFVIKDGVLTEYKGNGGKVVIPNGVKTIDKHVFYNNSKVTEIVVPKSTTLCSTSCFALCKNLKTITFKNKNTKLNYDWIERKDTWEEGVFYIGKYMDNDYTPAYKSISKSTLTIKGYSGSTAETLAKKIVAYPYGYKAVKFVDLSTKKIKNYGIKVPKSLTVNKGKQKTITVKLPSGVKKVRKSPSFCPKETGGAWNNNVTVTFKSNNKKMATVNSQGVVKGKKKGTVKIITTVSWGKDNVIHNSMGDIQTYKKTFTTTVKVQ